MISPKDQIPAHFNEKFDFAYLNVFVVPDLNDDLHATLKILQGSFHEQPIVEDSNGEVVDALEDGDYKRDTEVLVDLILQIILMMDGPLVLMTIGQEMTVELNQMPI